MKPLTTRLPYCDDSSRLFEAVADRPWSMFIDSGKPGSQQGRFDIIVADPVATVATWGELTEVRNRSGTQLTREDPFALLRKLLGRPLPRISGAPFCGGALGYFGYDLARRIERLPCRSLSAETIPDMAIGIYDWAVVVDHATRECRLVSWGRDPETRALWSELQALFVDPLPTRPGAALQLRGPLRSNLDRDAYGEAFRRVKAYIRAGDCYQVNLAQRFEAQVKGHPWAAYRDLRRSNPAPYSAYLNLPWCQVLSASPERFLQVRAGAVETKPIKGTRRRDPDPQRDDALAQALLTSPKDRAENLMIVDLLRNDIGKSCRIGSVRVPRLFALESFATVHHLVSTVTGELAQDRHAVDLLRGCFPGGSITGAPKLRAMEIIEELEPHRRGVYCGSIGYLGYDGDMDTNIAIRTLVHSDGTLRFWAGGGLVADSEEEEEYQETLDKAAAMVALLGSEEVQRVGS